MNWLEIIVIILGVAGGNWVSRRNWPRLAVKGVKKLAALVPSDDDEEPTDAGI